MQSEALQLARTIKDDVARSRALARLVPQLPAEERGAVLDEAVQAACSHAREQARSGVLADCVDALAHVPPGDLFDRWVSVLRALATCRRSRLCENLPRLVEVVRILAGSRAPAECLELFWAIGDVGRWFC